MPAPKRQKKTASAQPQNSQPPSTSAAAAAAEPAAEEQSEFAKLAKQHWLKPSKKATKVKVKNDVLKRDIWDPLEKEKFPLSSLLALEGLQILERSVVRSKVLSQPRHAANNLQLPLARLQRAVVKSPRSSDYSHRQCEAQRASGNME